MSSFKQHIQISNFNDYKSRIKKLKPNIDATTQKIADVLATGNQVPPEALITLGEYQIISQEWLSKLAPLDGFFEK